MSLLTQIAVFLAAAVLAVPLFRRLGLGSVLGYLAAGFAIGPWGLGLVAEVDDILHFGEIGVVLLLFVVGLELRPARLRAMHRSVFAPGSIQVAATAVVIATVAWSLGLPIPAAIAVGLALSLSSTAFVLQLLAERGELKTPHGRSGFGILLFQDIAVIPMLAVLPLLSPKGTIADPLALLTQAGWSVAVIAAFIAGGRYLLRPVFRTVAAANSHEIFTAAALLLVLGAALLMNSVGISMGLGGFLAGVLVADSEYRHQLEADIEPFEGLLLGLFFMAVGMSTNLALLAAQPLTVAGLALGLIAVKGSIVYALGRGSGLQRREALRLGAVLSQGGEFAFVLLGAAAGQAIMPRAITDLITLVVTVSMALTPLLVAIATRLARTDASSRHYDDVQVETEHRVVIAGFGRFGQIVGRILTSRGIPFTALEASPSQVDFVREFGSRIYYGDAARLELLRAANIDKADALILAVSDVETSIKIARVVRQHFPRVRVLARARNRQHVHDLAELGCVVSVRELYHSSLWLSGELLKALGMAADEAERTTSLFQRHDQALLTRQYAIRDDRRALIQSSQEAARELSELFDEDRRAQDGHLLASNQSPGESRAPSR